MIINHNITALNTYRQLNINSNKQSASMEKLSSGLRINKAGDDAAGLAISEKMRGQIRGLDQAGRNAQDGISMIQTAEGALNETHDILQRMRELATQASNDTATDTDRNEIQKEMNQLSSEVNRIGNTTEFNTQKLLNGSGTDIKTSMATITRGGAIGDTGEFAKVVGSTAEVAGVYTLTVGATDITAGSTVKVGDQTFTAVSGPADAKLGQFSIDGSGAGNDATVADSLLAAINQNATLSGRFTGASAAGVITLTERTGQATGVALTSSVAGTGTVAAAQTTASVKEVQGKYTFNLDKPFEVAGQQLTINGVALTAVAGNADPSAGQFNIGSSVEDQVKSIAAAINANTAAGLGQRFGATVDGNTISLTEKAGQATGTDLTAGDIVDGAASAAAGQYNTEFGSIIGSGGRVTIDGTDIKVVSDPTDGDIATGKAFLAGGSLAEQASRLATAINTNSALNGKYTASVTGDKLTLTQKTGKESLDAPVVTASTSAKTTFEANFQIGANTGQSMTIEINDMRSQALDITGDKSAGKVTAKNGSVASYVATANVSNGTDNNSVEFALDVSTHDKATAAISVINDAIETVSAQRSNLGAYQNRLEHTINNLNTSSENLTGAESRIRDVDMAKEMMQQSKSGILAQAAQAMLAQANQQPQKSDRSHVVL